ncbi:hypothetical protein MACJ_002387 [Theileria orientalis]|uniref:Uncharacterized protein n=1 Tax=Theileria orientalis TaxID=68886 RepID=A0A976M7J2_THEOR|nr:hypothetical protein MACJ_002387 [Theileria orientalis]
MKFYRNFLLIYLSWFLINGHQTVESKPSRNSGNSSIHGRGDSKVYRPIKRKPPRPPPERDKSPKNDDISTIHLIKVNINTRHKTDEFGYSYNIANKTHSYTATDGFLFKQLKDGRKTLWRSKQGKFADKITVKDRDDGYRSIRVFVPIDDDSSDSEDEGDRSSTPSAPPCGRPLEPIIEDSRRGATLECDPQDLKLREKPKCTVKLVVVDIKNRYNTNRIYYERNDLDNLHIFIAKEPYLIGKVKRGESVLWEYSDGHYGEEVILRYDRNGDPFLRINFAEAEPQSDYEYTPLRGRHSPTPLDHEIFFAPIPPKPSPMETQVGSVPPRRVTPSTPELLSHIEGKSDLEPQDGDAKRESDLTPITVDINKRESSKYTNYEYDSEKHTHTFTPADSYFIFIIKRGEEQLWKSKGSIFPEKLTILVDKSGNQTLRLHLPQDVVFDIDLTSEPEAEPEFYLLTLDVKIKESTSEVYYEYDEEHLTHTFTPRPGFLVDRVVKGRHQVWECANGVYPEKVFIVPDEHGEPTLRLKFPDVEIVPEPLVPGGRARAETNDHPAKTPIELNIGLESSTQFIDYSCQMDVCTFTPRSDCAFSLVKELRGYSLSGTQIIIWQATNPKEYLSKVEYNYVNYLATLYLYDGSIKKFKKISNDWEDYTHVDPSRRTPISLDIECNHSTYFFDYFRDGNTDIYIPRPEYIFKQVKRVTAPTIVSLDAIIWSTDDPDFYSMKVQVTDGSTVTVYSRNGYTKVFVKSRDNGWELVTEDQYVVSK